MKWNIFTGWDTISRSRKTKMEFNPCTIKFMAVNVAPSAKIEENIVVHRVLIECGTKIK